MNKERTGLSTGLCTGVDNPAAVAALFANIGMGRSSKNEQIFSLVAAN